MPGVKKYNEYDAKNNLIEAIAQINDDRMMSDLLPFAEALKATVFDRKQVNHRLKTALNNWFSIILSYYEQMRGYCHGVYVATRYRR